MRNTLVRPSRFASGTWKRLRGPLACAHVPGDGPHLCSTRFRPRPARRTASQYATTTQRAAVSARTSPPPPRVRCLEHQELNVETTWRVVRSRRAWVAAQAHTAHVRVHPRSSFPRLRTINGKHMSRGWASRTASQRPPPHHKGACISTNSPTHRLPRWL